MAARLSKVKQLARSQLDFDVGVLQVCGLLQAIQLVGDDLAPLVNGEEGLQYTLVFVPMTKVIHQGDVALSEKLAKLVGDVIVLPLCMFPSSKGLPLIQVAHESTEYAARFLQVFLQLFSSVACLIDLKFL